MKSAPSLVLTIMLAVPLAAQDTAPKPAAGTSKQKYLPMSPQVKGYRAVHNEVSKRTEVPLRFPRTMPVWADQENPIFAILESGDRSGYAVQLAWSENCLGGNWCHLGEIRGSTQPIPTNDGPKTPVTLRGGLKGYFIDSTCGAHCDDSEIQWREGQYYYSVAFKALDKPSYGSQIQQFQVRRINRSDEPLLMRTVFARAC